MFCISTKCTDFMCFMECHKIHFRFGYLFTFGQQKHSMPRFSGSYRSKLPKVETTIFTKMSQLATEQQAINLSQGFPDFNCSPELIELVSFYMKSGYNQYAHMAGYIGLREAISQKVKSYTELTTILKQKLRSRPVVPRLFSQPLNPLLPKAMKL